MFMELFKYYKTKITTPEFKNVVDFNINSQIIKHTIQISSEKLNTAETYFGLINSKLWKIYELKNHPGLIFIKNPFTPLGQRYWIAKCLEDYSKYPNTSNMWPLKQFSNVLKHDWWGELHKCCNKIERDKLMKSMRWVTLGYQYNWDDKIYDERLKTEFPKDLANLCSFISFMLKYDNFKSEAAIINYYPFGSTLAGHTDHSEADLKAPLLSISFGQSAIFLIGGITKEDFTTPILLESGDIVIMSQESRVCYHAVPRIFKSEQKQWYNFEDKCANLNDDTDRHLVANLQNKEFWSIYEDYISDYRINVNVRQVLPKGQTSL